VVQVVEVSGTVHPVKAAIQAPDTNVPEEQDVQTAEVTVLAAA